MAARIFENVRQKANASGNADANADVHFRFHYEYAAERDTDFEMNANAIHWANAAHYRQILRLDCLNFRVFSLK